MNYEVVIPNSCIKFIELQCMSDMIKYHGDEVINWLLSLNLNPKKVLDIGCGLGRASVLYHYENPSTSRKYILMDGDTGNETYGHKYESVGEQYYNRLSCTKEFCIANGIPENQLIIIDARDFWRGDKLSELNNIDIILSLRAMGFHWPIRPCVDKLKTRLSKDGLFCFEIQPRDAHDNIEANQWNLWLLNSIKNEFNITQFQEAENLGPLIAFRK